TVFAIEIEGQGIDSHSPACIKQPQHQIIILGDPQGLVIVCCWTSQDRFPEQRLEIAERWSSTVKVIELDIAADFDPEWLACPRAREQYACPLWSARIKIYDSVCHNILCL